MSGSSIRTSVILTAVILGIITSCPLVFAASRETPLVRAVQQCQKSVVNINTERFAAEEKESRSFSQKPRKVTGMGTGIIVDERGYIVTNYHVIQDVDKILVTMQNGDTFDGRPVSFDRKQDLAIIRIDAGEPLTVMPMGTSADLLLAETVFAVGNAYGYEHTITSGIISALSRDVEVDETQSYENLIQTDASINPGNSGGPLLNLDGEVIGINVAIRAGAQRIGFAIPIDEARKSIARLMSVERLNGMPHGLTTVDIKRANDQHLLVEKVLDGSASDLCGVRPGDVIVSIRGLIVRDGTDLERSLLDMQAGKVLDLVLERDGARQTLQYAIGAGSAASAVTQSTNAVDMSIQNPAAAIQTVALPEASTQKPATEVKKSSAELGTIALNRVWELLGMRLTAVSDSDLVQLRGRYNGGMKISSVRRDSLAAIHGVRAGDILVGLDGFETLSADNIRYIMSDDRVQKMTSLPFLIVRPGSAVPLQGRIDLSSLRR
jgi:serine protease Do